jgi:hypothetical protein
MFFSFFFSDIDENQQEQNSKNKNFAKISKIAKKCKVPPIIFSHIHVYVWQFNLMNAAAPDKNKVCDLQILSMQYLVRICFGFWILFAYSEFCRFWMSYTYLVFVWDSRKIVADFGHYQQKIARVKRCPNFKISDIYILNLNHKESFKTKHPIYI